ncbi:protein PAXX isoform X2 [Cuculus canorus]|uniref:protein PAXX isoform X2 n=1 Tax=Cuculus canorus TaxID=55661 RepID=UPI0023AAF8D9|nr:protein PAXX isoform X2 [Cuculus canorus]
MAAPPAPPVPGPFRVLRAGPGRFLCYGRAGGAVRVTDGSDVWSGGPENSASACRCPPEEHSAKLREALGCGAVSLSLDEGSITLRLLEEASCVSLNLLKLPAAEARSQLQELFFDMAGCIESLERRMEVLQTAVSPCSPEKNGAWSQQLFLPGKQLPGALPGLPLLICFLFSRRLLVLCPYALRGTRSPLGCGCCQPPHCCGALPSAEGARAERSGSRGVWDALCSGWVPGIARQVAR